MITNDTLLVQLTVGQLRDIIDDRVSQVSAPPDPDPMGLPQHGLKTLADFLGYTIPHTSTLVNEGKYPEAICRLNGRHIIWYPKVLSRLIQEESIQQSKK